MITTFRLYYRYNPRKTQPNPTPGDAKIVYLLSNCSRWLIPVRVGHPECQQMGSQGRCSDPTAVEY